MVSEADFRRLVDYMKSQAGIDLSKKRTLVETRLENYLATEGYASLGDYLNVVIQNPGSKEAEMLINILTTNHTFFWREEKHFEYFMSNILPELKKKHGNTKDLRIWCAASSSGEEPYTLAMCAMEYFGIEHSKWDTTVLATDISTKVLAQAQAGIYAAESVRALPASWQKKYFVDHGETMTVCDELKKQVLFRKLNLMDNYPFKKPLHVIFVRNVLIYFDDVTKKQIVDRMIDALEPGGYLFIGTTESISKDSEKIRYVIPSVYQKI